MLFSQKQTVGQQACPAIQCTLSCHPCKFWKIIVFR